MKFPSVRKTVSALFTASGGEEISAPPSPMTDLYPDFAGLPAEERARRIERRQRYERFAERQQLIDVEAQADHVRDRF